MYIIGINFGYKETTASFYDTEIEVARCLHILEGNTSDSCKVESAVCRNRKMGEWQFAKDVRDYSLPDFSNDFIGPMNAMTPKKKEAFAAFVRLVFEHILKNQEFLHYNPVTGERNFEIYVALGKENIDQVQEYKNFISCIIPLDWVIPGSMAVYFKFKAEKTECKDNSPVSSALVINIDSRSIDFTAYNEKGKQSFFKVYEHGSCAIEDLIYKYFEEHDEDFNKAKEEGEALCSRNNLDWRNYVIHYIKGCVKDFYNNKLAFLCLDLSNRTICGVKGRVFDDYHISNEQLNDEILAPYRQTLLQDMNDVKQRLTKGKNGIPEVVILAGDSSRMPWFLRLVADVFSKSQVFYDNAPSHVVSDGLVYYGTGIHKMKSAIENLKTSIATVFHEFHIQDYNTAYADYMISKMQDFLEDEHMLEYAKKEPEKQEEPIRLKKS